ncbi:polysaccharide pyruvyl transferase family protein [Clostridium paraputrificum]|uniref:polysaccharide pyruvyl transferase family protein n=1 Tax=Clostridium paraputrificum TaxID=29363 RepID=UPI00189F24B8|nr:polysaccharide pyruvyl transferase family protein [Clostridium paraputrificum]MDB2116097.1 polysaccharide pyruvyl transferase family protein [Clostridium paraputrificum]
MKKVGILSMQRIFNYGSFLQAYGLKSILEELGCKVEFVDYHPGDCLIRSGEGTGLKRKISKVLEVFKYNAPLKEKLRFIKYKKNYAKNYYPYLGVSEKMNYAPSLDLLVIGSDEVFNCVQNNTNVGFSPELFGEGNNAKRVISYAACFGNTTIEKLEKYNVKNQVSNWLLKMNAISVRDNNSRKIVIELTGKEPEYNLDPVLAYDFNSKCQEIPTTIQDTDYMILYGYSGRFSKEECKKIREYADSKRLKVFCIGGVQDCCDKFIDCNPFEVIAYFQHADCVVTDTFHGTILSIITHRDFATIIRSKGYGNSEKLSDLLKCLKLTNRILDNLESLEDIFNNYISYEITDSIIKNERKHTYDYLEKQINING